MRKKGLSISEKIIFYFSGAALLIMTVIIAVNSFSRYFFNKPLMFVEEIATAMFVWLVFLGAAVCYKQNMHIGIEVFVDMLPIKWQKAVAIAVDALMIVTNALLTILGFNLTISAWSKLTPVLRIPYSFIDIPAVLCFLFMTIYSIEFVIRDVRNFNKLASTQNEKEEN